MSSCRSTRLTLDQAFKLGTKGSAMRTEPCAWLHGTLEAGRAQAPGHGKSGWACEIASTAGLFSFFTHFSWQTQCFLASLPVKFHSFLLSQMLGRLCCATSTFKVKCFDSVALVQWNSEMCLQIVFIDNTFQYKEKCFMGFLSPLANFHRILHFYSLCKV